LYALPSLIILALVVALLAAASLISLGLILISLLALARVLISLVVIPLVSLIQLCAVELFHATLAFLAPLAFFGLTQAFLALLIFLTPLAFWTLVSLASSGDVAALSGVADLAGSLGVRWMDGCDCAGAVGRGGLAAVFAAASASVSA
jgi:hypothetical protein